MLYTGWALGLGLVIVAVIINRGPFGVNFILYLSSVVLIPGLEYVHQLCAPEFNSVQMDISKN